MIGRTLADRYQITSELGRGGMGVVYRGHDSRLNRDVAIKVISPDLLTEDVEERFKAEAEVVAQMDHPSIVSIFDFGQHDGSLYFVMPILEGKNLHDLIREQSLVLGDVLDIGIEVASALSYSHSRGVIHRDVKPENVMVFRDERGAARVRVMDFGLARRSRVTALTKTGVIVGTVSYSSPEQVGGKDIDGRSDVYSLGTVLYHCLTNEVPFTGELQSVMYRIVHEHPPPMRELGAEVAEELDRLVLSCLEKDPVQRPRSASDLMQALVDYRASLRDADRMQSVMTSRSVDVARPVLAPFVDRGAEVKELQQRLNAAVAGECQFVVISGDPGVGKTRLLDEIEALATARNIRVLHGRFIEQDAAFPYHGFCDLIQEYFRRKETGSSPSAKADFTDLGSDLIRLFPMLSEIEAVRSSGGTRRPEEIRDSRPPEDRTHIFELLARTLTRISSGQALVLLLEDLHGAEASLEALKYVVRRLGPTRTLIVGSYRSTDVDKRHPLMRMIEGFQGDRRFVTLALKPFSEAAHREYLATLVGGSQVVDSLAAGLYQASEGNPFFTKELLRSLLDSGSVTQDEAGAWTLSGGMEISTDALPATIQQAVETRIGRLPDALREILSIASVMGRTFDFRDLEVLGEGKGDLDEAVDRLVQEGLIEEDRRSRKGDRLTFSSVVVRDVLYSELSRRKRRSLHRKYAQELERRHAGRLERVYPRLVYHFSEGDVPEKTVEYGLMHAKKSLKAFGAEDVIRSAKTALDFLDDEWEGHPAMEGEARMVLAAGYRMAGDVASALREIEASIRIFARHEEHVAHVSALLFAAKTAWQARRTEETRRWVELGLKHATAEDTIGHLQQFFSLAATLASLRGESGEAAEYRAQAELLAPESRRQDAEEEIEPGGRLVVALSNKMVDPDPAVSKLVEEAEVYATVFERLLVTDDDGNVVAHLADKWESDDGGKSWHFVLHPGIRFHDGERLTAAAVKAAFEGSVRRAMSDLAPAFDSIQGLSALANGEAKTLAGIVAHADEQLEIRLDRSLPIYPALLTDVRALVVRRPSDDDHHIFGTGPFRLVSRDQERVIVERNDDYWKRSPANLDGIEFRHGLAASSISAKLRAGEIDLARDLSPQDLDEIVHDPRYRKRLVEVPQKMTYFVLFNAQTGPVARSEPARRALAGVIRARDLVWQTLGRFALPSSGILPPGMLGHDPGRRPYQITVDEARETLRSAGFDDSIRLEATVHPVIRDRYQSLLDALFAVWSEVGVEVSYKPTDMEAFLGTFEDNEGLDLLIGRWNPDYDDPDAMTHALFDSANGQFRAYFSSPAADEILEAARTRSAPAEREGCYRKFEKLVLDSGIVIPLHWDVDYRIAGPKVRGIRMRSTPPYVNYTDLGKADAALPSTRVQAATGGMLRIPMTGKVANLDPVLSFSVEQEEVLPSVYETLTRDVGEAQIVPWLAAEFHSEDGGRRYRFRLRDDVFFHDGRRLTARDVRYTFERLLLNPDSQTRSRYAPIRGAQALLDGEASDLVGFRIHSASEFTVELERPISFFPGLMAFMPAAIVPEGTRRCGASWRDGAVGTGAFRVARFEPGRRLEMERNPSYWREGFPLSQKLVFEFGVEPKQLLAGFRSGRYSLASDLFPEDVAGLRREATFAAGYRESPRLSTYYAVFNIHRGPLEEAALRHKIVTALDVPKIVRGTLGKVAIPAHGLIPPGLLGYEPTYRPTRGAAGAPMSSVDVELTAAVHPVFTREYSAFFDRVTQALGEIGIKIRPTQESMSDLLEAKKQASVDMAFVQWVADYPDTDAFVHILQSRQGFIGPLCGSPDIDHLIDRGRTETEPGARHATYRKVEETNAREARILPLFHEQVYRFARPEVEGLEVSYWSPTVAYEKLKPRG